jgi:hypothetical protein
VKNGNIRNHGKAVINEITDNNTENRNRVEKDENDLNVVKGKKEVKGNKVVKGKKVMKGKKEINGRKEVKGKKAMIGRKAEIRRKNLERGKKVVKGKRVKGKKVVIKGRATEETEIAKVNVVDIVEEILIISLNKLLSSSMKMISQSFDWHLNFNLFITFTYIPKRIFPI